MALMDKMKAQASQLAQKAQEAGKAGQAKVEDVQARRKTDALFRQLGAAVFAQRSGTATNDTAGEIDEIVAQLTQLEKENGPADTSEPTASESSSDTSTTPEGGFTL